MEETEQYWDWTKERSRDHFKEWLLPHLMVGVPEEIREVIRESTRNWSRINLRVSINGVELPGSGERLLSRLHETYQGSVNRSAEELIRDKFNDFRDLQEGLQRALKEAEDHVYKTFGIEPREW